MTKITEHPIKGTLEHNVPTVDKLYGKIIKEDDTIKVLKTIAKIKKDSDNPYDNYSVNVMIMLNNGEYITIGQLAKDSIGYNAVNCRPKEEYFGELLITEYTNKKYHSKYRISFDTII